MSKVIYVLRNSRGHYLPSLHESENKAYDHLGQLIADTIRGNSQVNYAGHWEDYKPVKFVEASNEH